MITKKADSLLRGQFTLNGKIAYSGTHTSDGTRSLWGQLALAGYVKPMAAIFHPFGYALTKAGRTYLESKPLAKAEKGAVQS